MRRYGLTIITAGFLAGLLAAQAPNAVTASRAHGSSSAMEAHLLRIPRLSSTALDSLRSAEAGKCRFPLAPGVWTCVARR